MPLIQDAFQMMSAVYTDGGGAPPAGWECVASWDNRYNEGLHVACYRNPQEKLVAIAFRGTDSWANWQDNIRLAWQQFPRAFHFACQFEQHLQQYFVPQGYRFFYVGHSLGAIHASLMACLRQSTAITYESPGIAPLLALDPNLLAGSQSPQTQIFNFFAAPNVINTLHPQFGQCYRLYLNHRDPEVTVVHAAKCLIGSTLRAGPKAALLAGPKAFAAAEGIASLIRGVAGQPIAKHAINTGDYLQWLLRQHSINGALGEFSADTAFFKRVATIHRWPRLTLAYPFLLGTTGLARFLTETVLFQPETEGLHTLFEENQMLETRIAGIPGYQAAEVDLAIVAQGLTTQITQHARLRPVGRDLQPIEDLADEASLARAIVAYTQNTEQRIENALAIPEPPANGAGAAMEEAQFEMHDAGHFEQGELLVMDPNAAAVRETVTRDIVGVQHGQVVLYQPPQ